MLRWIWLSPRMLSKSCKVGALDCISDFRFDTPRSTMCGKYLYSLLNFGGWASIGSQYD
jgi:hypothetical protein